MNYDELLKNTPKNWNRWGISDEIGSLNFLDSNEVLRGIRSVKQGKVFALSLVIGSPEGDPVIPGMAGAIKLMVRDHGHFLSKKFQSIEGMEVSDDFICMYLHATTHFDSLGHIWYDNQLWNGVHANTTMGGLEKNSIQPVAEHGVVGSAILLDMARFRGKTHLEEGETFGVSDIEDCAKEQNVEIEKHDILLIRTGWLPLFYKQGREKFVGSTLNEPGLVFSEELIRWFYRKEIPVLGTDTLANETSTDPKTGLFIPLHLALIRNLGVLFNETVWLEDIATDCQIDKQYRFLYVAAPLRIRHGSGGPVNPVAIK